MHMVKEMICIVCPRGCNLIADDREGTLKISGNACKRGEKFAFDELNCPMRSLTSTVKTIFPHMPYLPVRTRKEVKKESLPIILQTLRKFTLQKPVHCGDIIIPNIAGTSCDIIATRSI